MKKMVLAFRSFISVDPLGAALHVSRVLSNAILKSKQNLVSYMFNNFVTHTCESLFKSVFLPMKFHFKVRKNNEEKELLYKSTRSKMSQPHTSGFTVTVYRNTALFPL